MNDRRTSRLALATLVFALGAIGQDAVAADKFVRAGLTTGANNGNNWNDAYRGSSAIVWTAGNTYFFAGGNYNPFSVTASSVTLKRATASSSICTSAAGWNAAFDSQWVVNQGAGSQYGIFSDFAYNGIIFDGVVTNGFKVNGNSTLSGPQNASICFKGNNIQVLNGEFAGNSRYDLWTGGIQFGFSSGGIKTNILVRGCTIHNYSQGIFMGSAADYVTIENCTIYNIYGTAGMHNNLFYTDGPQHVIFRNNNLYNWSAVGISVGTLGRTVDDFQIYGNVLGPSQGNGVGVIISGRGSDVLRNIVVVNNTFSRLDAASVRVVFNGEVQGSNTLKNNIFYGPNTALSLGTSAWSRDYNWYSWPDPHNGSETHSIVIGGTNVIPFVSIDTRDFHIPTTISSTMPRDKGTDLGAPYNVDPDGVTRVVPWDMGAYEVPSSSQPPSQPSNVSPAAGAGAQTLTPTLVLSAYSGSGAHAASQFRVFNGTSGTLVYDSGSISPTTSKQVPGGILAQGVTYLWDGRYQNAGGWSAFSVQTSFGTAAVPNVPSITSPASGATNVSLTPQLVLSAYSGQLPQTAAQFQVISNAVTIWDSGTLGVVSSVQITNGVLTNLITYSARGRYANANGWGSYSAASTFTTTNTLPSGTIQWALDAYSVGQAGPSVVLTATRVGGSSGAISANYATANVTATAGHDYTAKTGTVNFAAGSTTPQTVTITILNSGDTATTNRTFTVTLSGAYAASPTVATVTILMNPPAPAGSISWTAPVYQTAYNAGSLNAGAYRFGGSSGLVGASFATTNGTALAGRDYVAASGTVSFANGVTNTATVSITILNSGQTSSVPRYFYLTLSSPTGGASLSGVSSALITIDMPPPPTNPAVLIIQNPQSVILQGGVIVTNR